MRKDDEKNSMEGEKKKWIGRIGMKIDEKKKKGKKGLGNEGGSIEGKGKKKGKKLRIDMREESKIEG